MLAWGEGASVELHVELQRATPRLQSPVPMPVMPVYQSCKSLLATVLCMGLQRRAKRALVLVYDRKVYFTRAAVGDVHGCTECISCVSRVHLVCTECASQCSLRTGEALGGLRAWGSASVSRCWPLCEPKYCSPVSLTTIDHLSLRK